jgi:hypothetical protein
MTNYRSKNKYKYIGIDPGKSGGVACIDEHGEIKAYKCPESSEDMALLFEVLIGSTPADNVLLLMERVWARPTNAVRAAFSYGTNYGQWLGIAASHEVQMNTAIPSEWIRWIGCPKALKSVIRKRWLKDKAKECYPELEKITLKTSDAILITKYAKEEYFNELQRKNT